MTKHPSSEARRAASLCISTQSPVQNIEHSQGVLRSNSLRNHANPTVLQATRPLAVDHAGAPRIQEDRKLPRQGGKRMNEQDERERQQPAGVWTCAPTSAVLEYGSLFGAYGNRRIDLNCVARDQAVMNLNEPERCNSTELPTGSSTASHHTVCPREPKKLA